MSSPAVPLSVIQRALKLLESHKKASKRYYEAHASEIKSRVKQYWEANKDAINERRRERYASKKKSSE